MRRVGFAARDVEFEFVVSFDDLLNMDGSSRGLLLVVGALLPSSVLLEEEVVVFFAALPFSFPFPFPFTDSDSFVLFDLVAAIRECE